MKRSLFVLVMLVWGFNIQAQDRLSPELIDDIGQKVVQIAALVNGEPVSTGSGTIMDANGVIYTNRHVVDGAEDYAILVLENPNRPPVLRYFARLVGMFEEADFAILQIDRDENGRALLPTAIDLPYMEADWATVSRGETVWAFGYPGTGEGYLVLTSGLITTVQEGDVGATSVPVWYQTDAEISPGNSGGLVVTSDGRPVGIPTAVQSEDRTLGRLAGLLPFVYLEALVQYGTPIVAGGTSSNPNAGSNRNNGGNASPPSSNAEPQVTGIVNICPDGERGVVNGMGVTVNMRAGFTYTATAVGIDGSVPLLMVYATDAPAEALCSSADEGAPVDIFLPTVSGQAPSIAQVSFNHSRSGFLNVSFVVGDANLQPGAFLLIIEGMAVTNADGLGDPFVLGFTPGMVASGIKQAVYMIGLEASLDPLFALSNSNFDDILVDSTGTYIACDDAGTPSCWGESYGLEGSYISTSSAYYGADGFDAMLMLDPVQVGANVDLPMLMSRANSGAGYYALLFHLNTR